MSNSWQTFNTVFKLNCSVYTYKNLKTGLVKSIENTVILKFVLCKIHIHNETIILLVTKHAVSKCKYLSNATHCCALTCTKAGFHTILL